MELKKLGIPTQKIKQLNRVGIYEIEDLVKYLPRKYYDFTKTIPIIEAKKYHGQTIAVIGTVLDIKEIEVNDKMKIINIRISDHTKWRMTVTFFNQEYVKKIIKKGEKYIFCGRIKFNKKYNNVTMVPLFFDKDIDKFKKVVPVYSKIKGMADSYLINIIDKALKLVNPEDYLEEKIRKKFNLIEEYDAFKLFHRPKTMKDIEKARKRFAFDDLFIFNFQLKNIQKNDNCHTTFKINGTKSLKPFYETLPFELTEDQKNVFKTIYRKMKQGIRENALIQGDVGTGKTIIAIMLMLVMADNGYQSCLMAPRESLARQHYEEIKEKIESFGYNVVFLSGNLKTKERKKVLKQIETGEAHLIVGTHAVFSKDIIYKKLGLTIADEQHLFGVEQRNELNKKSTEIPHTIMMSATPIPRTMAMALYGKYISVYTIKTKPKGRKEVITKIINDDKNVNEFIRREIKKGRQAYVVCPLIEDSEKMKEIESVESVYSKLVDYFKNDPDINVDMISGNMKPDEINKKISKFAKNETQILVSTTIIEVGINVPNSTVMVIKNAERFGLAQLHQLRGRVGRSSYQSYCILQTTTEDIKCNIMCSTTDGFEIAKKDLELRGPGDFLGTKQSGYNKYIALMLAYNELYKKIDKLTDEIYSNPNWYKRYAFLNEAELR